MLRDTQGQVWDEIAPCMLQQLLVGSGFPPAARGGSRLIRSERLKEEEMRAQVLRSETSPCLVPSFFFCFFFTSF